MWRWNCTGHHLSWTYCKKRKEMTSATHKNTLTSTWLQQGGGTKRSSDNTQHIYLHRYPKRSGWRARSRWQTVRLLCSEWLLIGRGFHPGFLPRLQNLQAQWKAASGKALKSALLNCCNDLMRWSGADLKCCAVSLHGKHQKGRRRGTSVTFSQANEPAGLWLEQRYEHTHTQQHSGKRKITCQTVTISGWCRSTWPLKLDKKHKWLWLNLKAKAKRTRK